MSRDTSRTTTERSPRADDLPGGHAQSPTEIPAAGWKQVVKRAWAEAKADNVPMLAGGVAFFAFLALFPAMIALISIWGLFVDADQAASQAESLTEGLPAEAGEIITTQMETVAGQDSGLGLALVISILLALWSASGGDREPRQGRQRRLRRGGPPRLRQDPRARARADDRRRRLPHPSVGLVAVVPPVLDALGLGVVGTVLAQVARWVLLVVLVAAALAVVYRFAPDRDDPELRWASLGAVVATVLWIVGSIAFSLYVSNFGSYGETYGAIAGVAILMLWLYLTAYIILLGAEINAETEKQTAEDTTTGPDRPMGQRDAEAADHLPER